MQVFFGEQDYEAYRRLLLEQVRRRHVEVWAYCLMPNHVHLIAVPADGVGLARALAEAHRRYAGQVNHRHGWRGHLWQERFWSFPMDEPHLRAVTRYVLLNPVRAGLVHRAEEWPFSSLPAHLRREEDALVAPASLDDRIEDWSDLLDESGCDRETALVRRHSATGRPLGDGRFVASIEERLGRSLRMKSPGRPKETTSRPPPTSGAARGNR